jgi:transcriptional regulator with XRE-family HTH domain
MTIVEIAGGMLRAARSLTGLSQQELAERASISRPCLTAWEGSSGSVPNAKARALHRVVAALQAEGVTFISSGVRLQRSSTVLAATATIALGFVVATAVIAIWSTA